MASSFILTKAAEAEGVTVDLCMQAIPLPRRVPGRCFHSIFSAAWRSVSFRPTLCRSWPVAESEPSSAAFFSRSSRGSIPSLAAIVSRWDSIAQVIWGMPKPRKAPATGLFV